MPISWERVEFYCIDFVHVARHSWKLQFDHIIFVGFGQACPNCSELTSKYYGFWKKNQSMNVFFFGFKWYTICLYDSIQITSEKSGSWMLWASQYAGFFNLKISKTIWGINLIFCMQLDSHGSYSLSMLIFSGSIWNTFSCSWTSMQATIWPLY